MLSSPGSDREPARAVAPWPLTWIAGLVPLAYYLATASAHGHWLDAGEFVAAARWLGIAHPPGQPLNAIVSAFFARLPVGPLAFRVAVQSSVLAALAIAFLFRAVFHTLVGIGEREPRRAGALALAAAWLVAGGSGFWLQAVRPEVYALEAALSAIVLDALLRFELNEPSEDLRPLYVAAFVEGLGLANHHFLAILLLPVAAPTLGRVFARRGFIGLFGMLVAPVMGLATYVYLPIRAGQEPPLNLGDPSTIPRMFWVVSAETFQKNTGVSVPLSFGERALDVVAGLVDTVGPWALFVGLFGLYLTLRFQRTRRFGTLWMIALVGCVLARAWLGFVRNNPDALGYLPLAFMAISALSACALTILFDVITNTRPRLRKPTRVFAYLVAGLMCLRLMSGAQAQSLARFKAPDAFDEITHRNLPPRAIVLAHNPSTIFRHFGVEAEEHVRPDVTLVPVPLLDYPGMVDALLAHNRELKPLLRGYLLDGSFARAQLQSLAAERPLFIELDLRVASALFDTIVPEAGFYRVLPDGLTLGDERSAAQAQRETYQRLYAQLGEDQREPQTQNMLLYRHFNDALYYAHLGDRDAARGALERGLAVQPEAKELKAMRKALADKTTKGPLDIRPFLPE